MGLFHRHKFAEVDRSFGSGVETSIFFKEPLRLSETTLITSQCECGQYEQETLVGTIKSQMLSEDDFEYSP